jgi:hypothetical protein
MRRRPLHAQPRSMRASKTAQANPRRGANQNVAAMLRRPAARTRFGRPIAHIEYVRTHPNTQKTGAA